MGFAPSPGTGGNSSIAGSTDVSLNSPQNTQVLAYDSSSTKWQNRDIESSGSAVAYAYYNEGESSWPPRPDSTTVVWVGGSSSTPPTSATINIDVWIRQAELV